ncbi:hypothetical protein FACS189460_4420 [Deltaproteobacteria bacterium]|nr:hypothetical protein FACS189460_4420 [Deltaproteobacteria bacterium]
MDKLFLHVCCGPCAAYPLEWFRARRPDLELEAWFYNPNIHPGGEFRRRRDSLAYLALNQGLKVDFSAPYDAADFLAALGAENSVRAESPVGAKNPVGAESPVGAENPVGVASPARCRICYAWRLNAAAGEA